MKRAPFRTRNLDWSGIKFLEGLIDPIDGLSETIFSILILLTYMLAFWITRISGASQQPLSHEDVNDLLLGILGAVVA